MGRCLWFAVGVVSLTLGGIGIVLPVLPTTPFVILAAFAFTKAWPAAATALGRHRVFGPIIADWRANGAIAPRYKLIAHVMMGLALGLSVIMDVPLGLLAIQAVCIVCASIYILSRPNRGKTRDNQDHIKDRTES